MSDDWFSSTTQGVVVPVASRTPWLWDSRKLKFDRFGRTVGLWWSLVCWFVVFLFFFFDVVGLLSYIELCGDDNFVGIFNCIYIYILVSFYLSKLYFPPKKTPTQHASTFFLKNFFTPRTLWQNVDIVCWKVFACLPALCRSFFFSSGRVGAGSRQFLGSHNRRVVVNKPAMLTP